MEEEEGGRERGRERGRGKERGRKGSTLAVSSSYQNSSQLLMPMFQ